MKGKINVKTINEFLESEQVEGLLKVGLLAYFKYSGIGQDVLLKNVLDSNKGDNLVKVLEKVSGNKKEDTLKAMETEIKDKGFMSAVSLTNYAFQLEPDIRGTISTILQDKTGRELLKKTVNHILQNYTYTS